MATAPARSAAQAAGAAAKGGGMQAARTVAARVITVAGSAGLTLLLARALRERLERSETARRRELMDQAEHMDSPESASLVGSPIRFDTARDA